MPRLPRRQRDLFRDRRAKELQVADLRHIDRSCWPLTSSHAGQRFVAPHTLPANIDALEAYLTN
jgi:hypothetical protein